MSDKRKRADPKRVFPSWIQALYLAVSYANQTGFKWRVYRAGPVWRIQRTSRPFVADFSTGKSAEYVRAWAKARALTGRPAR